MIVRKAFYRWLFPAAVVLPVWLLVGWGVFGAAGWSFFGLLILCPVLFLALLAVGALVFARKSVRAAHMVSWYDVGLLAAWHASIIAFGFYPAGLTTVIAAVGVLLGLATFWLALWQLMTETRKRVKETLDAYARIAEAPSRPEPSRTPLDLGEVIVVRETDHGHEARW